MDANVLRAALSAAIRVTVSSAMVGCGGATIADPPGAGHAEPSTSEPPKPQVIASAGAAPRYPENRAGTSPSATAGMTASGGGGGTPPAEGGAPAADGGAPAVVEGPKSFCEAPAMQACQPIFDALIENPPLWSEPLEPEALGCCTALVAALDASDPRTLDQECREQLDRRLNEVRFPCCPALDFQGQACAPWGPPVPPELDLEQLLAWSAAA